ncbi:ArsR/SmtB family transcription factor [Streptomyces sp. NPDC059209]|uniref:ArsR/SmtB family transcription factor n=1 Tax=Streptomyces sp. NPDC059209 TaxID=3346769 RepID=UPI003684E167
MIRVEMPAERLAGVRYSVSPGAELAALLLSVVESPSAGRTTADARDLLRSGRLPTLAALCRGFTVYLPEFLTPHPGSFAPDPDEQLHQVATAATERVRQQVEAFVMGGAGRGRSCPWLADDELTGTTDSVRARFETGERDLAERLATELEQLWHAVLAPRWPRLTTALEAFVERQARIAARHGMGNALGALHPSLEWQDDALTLASRYRGTVEGTTPLTLVPSGFLRRVALHAPYDERGGLLAVPVGRPVDAAPGPRIAPVLGETRLALLESLDRRRTTTELARLHHLTPGSISYHLSRMLSADLVRRERRGRLVHYTRTARAQALLGSSPA